MSRFQIGDVIRHRTGMSLFYVCPHNMVKDMYLVKPDGAEAGVFQPLACSYVDENFILFERRIQDEIITEDPQRVMQWRDEVPCGQDYRVHMPRGPRKTWYIKPLGVRFEGKLPALGQGYGTDLNASARKGRWVKAAPPVKIDQNAAVPEDVAVTLEGIPQGYYLKAFRDAGPADLIIKTNGVICKEADHLVKKKSLIRPIVAPIPEDSLHVPGVPAGHDLVRIGTPQPGDLFVDPIGGVSECMKHSATSYRAIVRKKVDLTPCTGVLPGIPLGYKVVRFGDVSPEEFYFDTAGNLKQGPSKHRLVVEKVEPPICIPPWMKGPVFKGPVDWGVVDRKVRQDAVDAAAYAAEHLKRQSEDTAFTEREFMNVKSRTTVWTTAPDIRMQGTEFIPTGRARKVKVI